MEIDIENLDHIQDQLKIKYNQLKKEIPISQDIFLLFKTDPKKAIEYLDLIRQFFFEYDEFNINKIDYFFNHYLSKAKNLIHDNKIQSKKIKNVYLELETIKNTYDQKKHLFRSDDDTKRLEIGIHFFPIYCKLINLIRINLGESPTRNYGRGDLQPFVDTIGDLFKIIDRYVLFLYRLYFKNKVRKKDEAPVVEALALIQERLASMKKIKTSWEGLKNIENLDHDGKTLNLFAMNHSNSFFDTCTQQQLPVKGISSIGDVDIFFPNYIVKQLISCEHFVAIGHGDTNTQTLNLVKEKILNKFFLAIEGITGVGLFETRPVMPKFGTAVYEMIDLGLDLKIYPVVFTNNFTLLNDWRKPFYGDRTYNGLIQKPITNQDCLNVFKATNSTYALSEVIRWGWFANIIEKEDRFIDMPKPSTLIQDIDKMTFDN